MSKLNRTDTPNQKNDGSFRSLMLICKVTVYALRFNKSKITCVSKFAKAKYSIFRKMVAFPEGLLDISHLVSSLAPYTCSLQFFRYLYHFATFTSVPPIHFCCPISLINEIKIRKGFICLNVLLCIFIKWER